MKNKIKIVCECLGEELLRHNKNLTKKQYYAVLDSITVLNDIIKENKYKTVKYSCKKIGLETEE